MIFSKLKYFNINMYIINITRLLALITTNLVVYLWNHFVVYCSVVSLSQEIFGNTEFALDNGRRSRRTGRDRQD